MGVCRVCACHNSALLAWWAMNEAVDISDFKGSLDVRRKMFVARGRVSDLKRDCIIAKDEDFDVEHSIFSVFGRSLPLSLIHI